MATTTAPHADYPYPPCGDANCGALDRRTLLAQIGPMNIGAISGFRVQSIPGGVRLPVSNGYAVEVVLNCAADTYTVRRTLTRSGERTVKGEATNIYFDQVGEIAYQASCYHNGPFGN